MCHVRAFCFLHFILLLLLHSLLHLFFWSFNGIKWSTPISFQQLFCLYSISLAYSLPTLMFSFLSSLCCWFFFYHILFEWKYRTSDWCFACLRKLGAQYGDLRYDKRIIGCGTWCDESHTKAFVTKCRQKLYGDYVYVDRIGDMREKLRQSIPCTRCK